jgi:hypothetical protein
MRLFDPNLTIAGLAAELLASAAYASTAERVRAFVEQNALP